VVADGDRGELGTVNGLRLVHPALTTEKSMQRHAAANTLFLFMEPVLQTMCGSRISDKDFAFGPPHEFEGVSPKYAEDLASVVFTRTRRRGDKTQPFKHPARGALIAARSCYHMERIDRLSRCPDGGVRSRWRAGLSVIINSG